MTPYEQTQRDAINDLLDTLEEVRQLIDGYVDEDGANRAMRAVAAIDLAIRKYEVHQ